MGSSCVIIVDLVVITLGDVTISVTLGGGTVTITRVGVIIGTLLGNTVVWFLSGCIVLKICASLLMACN